MLTRHLKLSKLALTAATLSLGFSAFTIATAQQQPPQPVPAEAKVVLPKSIPADGKPQINGAWVTSGTPGHVFFYRIPATGDAPLNYSIDNLPAGLTVDAASGIVTGSIKDHGVVTATIHVKNAKGQADRSLVIVGEDHKLALTPPMGWNSWNAWGTTVDDAKVRACADAFDSLGLAAHGFQYVNIDDGWEIKVTRQPQGFGPVVETPGTRDEKGNIITNDKFPNMKALGDYIHSKGLKFGIYSGPGPNTCGNYAASWQHEEQDATSWASWGVDYIKYDWCSYDRVMEKDPAAPRVNSGFSMDSLKKPYQVLRKALDKQDRDMIMSLCQYGWGEVWKWGADDGINGNLWRATGDITDNWGSMAGIGFQQNGHEMYAAPGHWNDTDMLVVGRVSWGARARPTGLTQNEQMTHIGLWSILAAPLLLGCDLSQADEFTVNLMSNDEVLAVNQDPLGMQGHRISMTASTATAPANPPGRGRAAPPTGHQVWARPLWDGTIAVGLFNLDNEPAKVSTTLKELNDGLKTDIAAGSPVRDLWYLKNLDAATETISAEVPRHGIVLLKIGKPKPTAECVAELAKMHTPKPAAPK